MPRKRKTQEAPRRETQGSSSVVRNSNYYERTRPPMGYVSPSDAEIKDALKSAGFNGSVSLQFVRDLANVAAGGTLVDSSEWLAMNDGEADLIKQSQSVQQFIRGIDWDIVTGNSPLEKAVAFTLAAKATGAFWDGDEEGEIPLIPNPNKSREEASKFLEAIKDFSDFEREMLEIGQGDDLTSIAKLSDDKSVALATLSAKLKKSMKFNSTKSRRLVVDPRGSIKRAVSMTEYSQIAKMRPMSQAILPNYSYKLATKQLQVYEKVKVVEEKQLLFLLVDQSASMAKNKRVGYALAVVLNRLEAVKQGTAELYVSLFDDVMSEPVYVKSEEDARELFNKFRHFKPKGGGTNIDSAIKNSVDIVKSMRKGFADPQIVIVTDGEDAVTQSKSDIGDVVLNYVAITAYNQPLKDLAISTGGAFIYCE